MSTNFLLWMKPVVTVLGDTIPFDDMDPNIHVGVRRASTFVWAQEPERLKAYGEANPKAHFITNEYGSLYSWSEFLGEIKDLKEDRSMIGKRFF